MNCFANQIKKEFEKKNLTKITNRIKIYKRLGTESVKKSKANKLFKKKRDF